MLRMPANVELCLFDHPEASTETVRIKITNTFDGVWHIYLPGIQPGQLVRLQGVRSLMILHQGHRHNPHKLLIDPYARAITGHLKWDDAVFGYQLGHPEKTSSLRKPTARHSCPNVWSLILPLPGGKTSRSIFHSTAPSFMKRMCVALPSIILKYRKNLRGTYAGLAYPVMIKYLKELGITAVELLPVHHFVLDKHLIEKGLTNYWGYNTIGFFAPEPLYCSNRQMGDQVKEFKSMVKSTACGRH